MKALGLVMMIGVSGLWGCMDDGLDCGPGTVQQGRVCVAAPGSTGASCGSGTVEMDGVCVPAPGSGSGSLTCGPGTADLGGECVPLTPGYLVRSTVETVPANGYSKIPFFAIGTKDDGTPALDQLVFTVSPTSAGTISPAEPTLTALGTSSFFTPCSSSDAGCTGLFEVNIALKSDPSMLVATTGPLQLVVPTGVGSPAPCLIGGNVMFFDGMNDWVYSGTQTVTQASWNSNASTNNVHVGLTPAVSSQGLWWDVYFDSSQLGKPLTTTVYEDAERWPFQAPQHPGLSLSGDGRGCNTLTGRFQIEDLAIANNSVKRLTATYEQHCEGGPGVVRGCVHLEM